MDSSRLLPTSRAMIAASSNLRSRIRPAAWRSVATRWRHDRCAQSRWAAFAAATARPTCSGAAVANRPRLVLRDNEGRRDHHEVAIGPVRVAHIRPQDEPLALRRFDERLRELRSPRERRARLLVFHEFDASEEPAPAHVAYVRQAPERGESPLELLPHLGTARHEPMLLQVAYGREARGARHRMVRVRLRVHEAPGAVRDHVDDPL